MKATMKKAIEQIFFYVCILAATGIFVHFYTK